MSPITTHVLDTAAGKPAAGIAVELEVRAAEGWRSLGRGRTDADGRIKDLLAEGALSSGLYRLTFAVGEYLAAASSETFYDQIPIEFKVTNERSHYHVPLLLSPFGYSTYRGS